MYNWISKHCSLHSRNGKSLSVSIAGNVRRGECYKELGYYDVQFGEGEFDASLRCGTRLTMGRRLKAEGAEQKCLFGSEADAKYLPKAEGWTHSLSILPITIHLSPWPSFSRTIKKCQISVRCLPIHSPNLGSFCFDLNISCIASSRRNGGREVGRNRRTNGERSNEVNVIQGPPRFADNKRVIFDHFRRQWDPIIGVWRQFTERRSRMVKMTPCQNFEVSRLESTLDLTTGNTVANLVRPMR